VDPQPAVAVILAADPDAVAVYLFGSRARGDARAESDMDLAVLSSAPFDPVACFDLQERIAERLRASVDLVDLRTASTVLRVQVLEHGVLLHEGDPGARARSRGSRGLRATQRRTQRDPRRRPENGPRAWRT